MAKFTCNFPEYSGGDLYGKDSFLSGLSSEDMLTILRPAAAALVQHYKNTILRLFKRRTGSLADSIKAEEMGLDRAYMDASEASITVGPKGKHKGSKRAARSRKGSSSARYAKHNRTARSTAISNAELGYLLEVGTPRIAATHWMENANEEISDSLQQMIEEEFNKVMESKGL